jgi:hypothetical protein
MWIFIAFDGPTKFGSHFVYKHTNIFGGSFSSIMPHPCIQQVAHDPASFSFFQFEEGERLSFLAMLCACEFQLQRVKTADFPMALLGEQPKILPCPTGQAQPKKEGAASSESLIVQKEARMACQPESPKRVKRAACSSSDYACWLIVS